MNPRLSLRRVRSRELARRLRIQDHLNCLSEDMGEVLASLDEIFAVLEAFIQDDDPAVHADRPRHPQRWN